MTGDPPKHPHDAIEFSDEVVEDVPHGFSGIENVDAHALGREGDGHRVERGDVEVAGVELAAGEFIGEDVPQHMGGIDARTYFDGSGEGGDGQALENKIKPLHLEGGVQLAILESGIADVGEIRSRC